MWISKLTSSNVQIISSKCYYINTFKKGGWLYGSLTLKKTEFTKQNKK